MLTLQDLKNHVALPNPHQEKHLFGREDILPDNIFRGGLSSEHAALDYHRRRVHYAMGFFDNKDWLFQGIKYAQPETYRALMDGSDLYLRYEINSLIPEDPIMLLYWYMEIGGRLVELRLQNVWETSTDMARPLTDYRDYAENLMSLGSDLSLAYSTYCHGFNFPKSFVPFDKTDELPISWTQIYVPMLRAKGIDDEESCSPRKIKSLLKKEFVNLYKTFPYLKTEHKTRKKHYSGSSTSLRIFLQTRSDPAQVQGDYIIMQTPQPGGDALMDMQGTPQFFRVKDQNWMTIERLIEPQTAVDHYVAHTLRNETSTFDFNPYCEPL